MWVIHNCDSNQGELASDFSSQVFAHFSLCESTGLAVAV